jgi:hypothetical protein
VAHLRVLCEGGEVRIRATLARRSSALAFPQTFCRVDGAALAVGLTPRVSKLFPSYGLFPSYAVNYEITNEAQAV